MSVHTIALQKELLAKEKRLAKRQVELDARRKDLDDGGEGLGQRTSAEAVMSRIRHMTGTRDSLKVEIEELDRRIETSEEKLSEKATDGLPDHIELPSVTGM